MVSVVSVCHHHTVSSVCVQCSPQPSVSVNMCACCGLLKQPTCCSDAIVLLLLYRRKLLWIEVSCHEINCRGRKRSGLDRCRGQWTDILSLRLTPCGVLLVSATVSPISATISRPNENAVVRCVGATPTATVSAWYQNSSDGHIRELSQKDGSKYRVSNNSLTVMKVGE